MLAAFGLWCAGCSDDSETRPGGNAGGQAGAAGVDAGHGGSGGGSGGAGGGSAGQAGSGGSSGGAGAQAGSGGTAGQGGALVGDGFTPVDDPDDAVDPCATLPTTAAPGNNPSLAEAVQVSATVRKSPATISVCWRPQPGTTGYSLFRKLKSDDTWGSALATLDAATHSYTDATVAVGTYYEYKIARSKAGRSSAGYIAAGIDLAAVEDRGVIVLLVDDDIKAGLAPELKRLTGDLNADGWRVIRHDVARSTSAPNVRQLIKTDYAASPSEVKAVYIVGHVAVPYSGRLNPDGHSDHLGAWAADGYYAELDGDWTDSSVNIKSAQLDRNYNVPGDGKFDQSAYPSPLELQVSRVDFQSMSKPYYAFDDDEVELTRKYLNKAHAYKAGKLVPTRRGIVFDNLLGDNSMTMAASGYRNVSALVGPEHLTDSGPTGPTFDTLINGQSYLWTYASGGGTWVSADKVGNTDAYAAASFSFGGVFNMMMGSYFGDWDITNNFLRAVLASGDALTIAYAGIPHWFFQHMGMGDNIGYSARVTMNNIDLYTPQSGGWNAPPAPNVHLALLGDLSLRNTVVAPPTQLEVSSSAGVAAFSWTAPSEPVDGYYLYEFDPTTGALTRLTPHRIIATSFSHASIPFVSGKHYMVRALKRQTTNTGRFYDLSLGARTP